MLYSLLKPLLFCLEPEKAHAISLETLHWLPQWLIQKPKNKTPINIMGLTFPHRIGLAAGLDKNAEHLDALSKLGFSFIEVGTVTPKPQAGNPKPRLFRLPEVSAIINRMGFNNDGVEKLVLNLSKAAYKGILGINIGKNKDTPLTKAADDYIYCLRKVYPYASYVTINISSPNTPNLRLLHEEKFFSHLLLSLSAEQQLLADYYQRLIPFLVKISPDETDDNLKRIAELVIQYRGAGIIATNTTCSKQNIAHLPRSQEQGGLSGPPLFDRATQCLRILKEAVGNELVLIGVGGIDSPQAAATKLNAGASLLQVYTGLIYQGPDLIKRLAEQT